MAKGIFTVHLKRPLSEAANPYTPYTVCPMDIHNNACIGKTMAGHINQKTHNVVILTWFLLKSESW